MHSVEVVAETVVNATHAQPHWAAQPLEHRQNVLLEFNRLLKEVRARVCVCGEGGFGVWRSAAWGLRLTGMDEGVHV